MNAVAFYSNTGRSRAVAEYFSERLNYPLLDIMTCGSGSYQSLVLVFPVHCQNIPNIVKGFLKRLSAQSLTVIATYGRMCPGNVLYEIQRKYGHSIVAGAYIPTGHSYIDGDDEFSDFDKLSAIVDKMKIPSEIRLPRLYKNPLANILPTLRTRLGLKITASNECDGCGVCTDTCPVGAMCKGKADRRCLRCMRCVNSCPRRALEPRLGLPMRLYLRKKRTEKTIIYV